MIYASPEMLKYFDDLKQRVHHEFKIATAAKEKGYDPEKVVEVKLAETMAERVVGLISVIAPQIVDMGVEKRIQDLEEQYGSLDWRVALQIALEVAQEKFCKFKDKRLAIEIGIKLGFAYGTVGVVSSPIEGLVDIEIKRRQDGRGEFFCLNFSGPIRNAGGTAASWSVIIADHVRKKMGYDVYDPTENEMKRCASELEDYHERVTNLQYFPSKEESRFLIANIPVEISGDASEKFEVSNYKDLPRVKTNLLRSGYCLIHSSCIPLKAPKLWKQLSKWGKDFDLEHWNFLEEFLKIQKKAKAKGAKKSNNEKKEKITPDGTYIKDLVAGRPVLGHPLRHGAFRLRYGRSRGSGYSAQSINPASMHVLNDYIAVGTQLKVERPGKGATYTPCDLIEGPIVKLKDGSVHFLETEQQAKQCKKEVEEILYLGDALISYGDFFNRAHPLVPPGYCEEWWIQELEKATVNMFGTLDEEKLSEFVEVPSELLSKLIKEPIKTKLSSSNAINLSKKLQIPLHPRYTYHWNAITKEDLLQLINWLQKIKIEKENGQIKKSIVFIEKGPKRFLELIGVPHIVASNEYVVLDKNHTIALIESLNLFEINTNDLRKKFIDKFNVSLTEGVGGISGGVSGVGADSVGSAVGDTGDNKVVNDSSIKNKLNDEDLDSLATLDIVQKISKVQLRDKSGIFIGSRMGRPEKAKMRKLTGSPHVLFPVGEEGGRLRCFQAALQEGRIRAEVPTYKCTNCDHRTVLSMCEKCDKPTTRLYQCSICGEIEEPECSQHGFVAAYKKQEIDIENIFKAMLKKLDTRTYPDLIKGVRGTNNKDRTPEHIIKGILRAKHRLHVNKEGTIRYDASELPITHFKAKEIGVSVEQLKELGYEKDIKGKELVTEEQILEIKPQDVLLPCCPDAPEEPCDEILFRVTKFLDELMVKVYGLAPFYNLKSKKDLVGHLVIGLAPHTSAGILGRIIGFTKTQGFFAHPYMHAAMRRDTDGDESCIFLTLDAFINFSRKYLPQSRGSTMDAPLVLTTVLIPAEVDDMVFDMDIASKYSLDFYEAACNYKMPWDV
ncbi:hypothetical protein HN814_02080, partial [Candidatus Woesearchaeota archaeon]|nr:hypothetical protein [Candidatus Woesearchaeota archaeon]